ncbi:ABC transporter permease [Halalkalibacter akibai]|uniref:ABC transporter permease n=1 Tax=Halalkalibacter akibai (strain ATCC 43226 / DSM 21942 / CIP 109018 / JCM 9157 / 1139) TaxID=1236973 RepID=W4QYL6_HALA3|nr:ABC transporter permease [Halalkalibacter akibai]GAE37240.1 hypothetical protein JCM9157_4508 [Halalkalibacter akibai JCM 9157]
MWKQLYNQTGSIVRFIVRRDRVRMPIWIISLTIITLVTAAAFTDLYQSEQERQAIAETMKNPAMTAMVGPGYGLDHYIEGPMMAHQMLLFTAIVVAIMSILLVARHTRLDEEEGRVELIRALPVGRLSNISATLSVMFALNIVIAFAIGFGLTSLGIESIDLVGSLLYGAAIGSIGMYFAAVTGMFAQLSDSSRGTIGYSFTVLGVFYIVRAIGDVGHEPLSWLSPLGLILRTEVYVNNYWWPVIFTVGSAVLITLITFYLNSIRDLNSGFLPTRPGPKQASRFLQNPIGLAVRLQRTSMIAWAIGMYILGVSYGSILGDLEAFIESNEMMSQMLSPIEGLTMTEQFLTMLMSIISMICTIPALMMMLKLKGEEKKNRTENLLSGAVSRYNVIGSYFLLSFFSGFFMLFLAFIGLWSAATVVMDDPISFFTMFKAAMIYLPAIWFMIALTVLLIGLFPQFTSFIWLYLGYSFLVVYLGNLLPFPEWMGKLSPYAYIPKLPVEEINYLNITVLTVLAILLVNIGFIAYKKRDIAG